MELNIQKKEEKPLLQAEDLYAEITYEATTPSRKELVEALAKKTKTPAEQVIVRKIQGIFGHRKAKVEATLYKDKALLEKVENQPLLKRHKGKEDPKAEQATPKAEEKQTAPKQGE